MTEAEYDAWYESSSARVTQLIEVDPLIGDVPTMIYLSTVAYITYPNDIPSSTPYLNIATSPRYTESMTLAPTGNANLSAGEVELNNASGEYDEWLMYMWVHRRIRIWEGDVSWPRADFRLVFDGVTAGLGSKSAGKLNILLRDKLEQLNAPLTEDKLGGSTPNKDEILPVPFGEVHNLTPLLVDPTQLEYQCGRLVRRIIEVRDNGVKVGFQQIGNTGRFRLLQTPDGTITCSVKGDVIDDVYVNTAAGIIQRIATCYGKASTRLTVDDIDLANFSSFEIDHPQPLGLYIGDRTNVLDACQKLAASVGAQLAMSPLGKLQLLKIELPPPGPVFEIPQHLMYLDSLKIVSMPPVRAAVKLGFGLNYTEQDLQTDIPAEHLDLYRTKWLSDTAVDEVVQDVYKLHADPVQEDTQLVRRADAAPEAVRRRDLWSTQRRVFEFKAKASCLKLSLGQAVRIYNTRFNLTNGALGMVVSLSPDRQNRCVTVQVLV